MLVLERPWGGSAATLEGLGAARHAWTMAWRLGHERFGFLLKNVVRVYPATWRAALFGRTKGTKPLELARASKLFGAKVTDPDMAAAICIAEYACRCGEVGALVRRKRPR